MKFSCTKQELCSVISNVSRAVSSKSTTPALEGIKIEAGEYLSLYGYNSELAIWSSLNADISEEGGVVLNARHLGDICRRLPSEYITIETDEKNNTLIRSGKSEFTLMGIDVSEFPEMPMLNEGKSFSVKGETLQSMIKQTIFSVGMGDVRPIWTGTLFEIREDYLRLVSVDGYRLAIRDEKIKFNDSADFIVPGKTLQEIEKFLSNNGETEIKITSGKKHVMFEIDEYTVISRLIEGQFVDYMKVIPTSEKVTVTVNVSDLINSVERASILITERLRSPIKLSVLEDMISISCITSEGKVYDEIGFTSKSGETMEIGFNNKYMLDALRAVDGDEVRLIFNGATSPIKIVPKEGEDFIFIIVPVTPKK